MGLAAQGLPALGDLVAATVRHFAERYGVAEAADWYWELWNEPDILSWQGTVEEYGERYDVTVAAVRSVLPWARVGGPPPPPVEKRWAMRPPDAGRRVADRARCPPWHTRRARARARPPLGRVGQTP